MELGLPRRYRAEAVVTIEMEDPQEARLILNSVKPEVQHPASYRSRVQARRRGRKIELKFLSTDSTALRASINSFLRFILACRRVMSEVKALEGADH